MYSVFEQEPITERKLIIKHKITGSKHDPHGYTEYIVQKNGIPIILHMGLDSTWIMVAGKIKLYEKQAFLLFEQITGFTEDTFEKTYTKLHHPDKEMVRLWQ